MKLLIQKRGEVLSTGTPGLVLDATLLLPGATCSCTTDCCCSCTTGMTASLAQKQDEKV